MTAMPAKSRPPERQPLLTIDEVAAELRKSRTTVYRLINSGAIPTIQVGWSARIDPVDLDKYKAAHRSGDVDDVEPQTESA